MVQQLKNDLLKSQAVFDAWKLIQQVKTITLLTHAHPDGDGISACAALEHILHKCNKQVETIYPCPPEFDVKRQPKNLLINTHKQIPDLIIMCDTATYDRAYYPEVFKKIPLINIDHHISNTITGAYNFVDTNHSSTCEGLFLILHAVTSVASNLIDTHVTECLLSGILYDSLIFQTQSTTPQTLRIAAHLIEHGADLYALKTELIANKNPRIVSLWGKVMSSVQIVQSGKAVFAKITQKDLKDFKVTLTSLVGFHNFLSQVSTVDVTILFYETESGQTKVSLRSKATDVNKLAAHFGGGGHKNAAGFYSDLPIKDVVTKVIEALEQM
jgi:phosphoesterase RecJ-like protein